MLNLDLAKINVAIDRLLEVTDNPRHRYLLMAYARHRLLESTGQYDKVTDLDMMSDKPAYKVQALGFNMDLKNRDTIANMYRMWAQTNQCIFYAENEQVAVADNFITSVVTLYQQVWGQALILSKILKFSPKSISNMVLPVLFNKKNWAASKNSMYLVKTFVESTWLYDDQCRLICEHVWEPSGSKPEIIKLDPKDVVTTEEAHSILGPLIQPLPSFDNATMAVKIPWK